MTGNYDISYFQPAAKCINMLIFGHIWLAIFRSMTILPISEAKVLRFLKRWFKCFFLMYCKSLNIFAPWPWKWGSNGPTVVYAIHKWLVLTFSKNTNASNLQIYTLVVYEGLYIMTRNDVISYFRLATNRKRLLSACQQWWRHTMPLDIFVLNCIV